MGVVTNYRNKKLTEYLKPGMSVLILFDYHGVGDCVMFMPIFRRLQRSFPAVTFSLQCNKGQDYFTEINAIKYDEAFRIGFPEWDMPVVDQALYPEATKVEVCCVYEIGISYDKSLEFTWKPEKPINCDINVARNTIGVSFQVTSGPFRNIPFGLAGDVWRVIKDNGFSPLEVQFEHKLKNSVNRMYSFIDSTCRHYTATVENLIGTVNQCTAFVGVNTGSFCIANCLLPSDKIFELHDNHPFYPHYRRFTEIQSVDYGRFPRKEVLRRLEDFLKKTHQ